jgi:hypothetical protein
MLNSFLLYLVLSLDKSFKIYTNKVDSAIVTILFVIPTLF